MYPLSPRKGSITSSSIAGLYRYSIDNALSTAVDRFTSDCIETIIIINFRTAMAAAAAAVAALAVAVLSDRYYESKDYSDTLH